MPEVVVTERLTALPRVREMAWPMEDPTDFSIVSAVDFVKFFAVSLAIVSAAFFPFVFEGSVKFFL